jgi:uncharacterized membrane protein SpoIIM required for sporulation
MREGQFIKKNLERWEHSQEDTDNPDELAKRFAYLIDDLAYAKTFYPNSNTVRFINGIAANLYLSIYKNKKIQAGRLLSFWTTELPLVIRKHHRLLLFSFIVFSSFVVLGFVSAKVDQSLIRAILSDGYVEMTEANIASGHPFAVYNSQSELEMFLRIAFNNISVAFRVYLFGLSFGVLTVHSLFTNGLMVGAFECMFFQHHLGLKSILVIFIHGTIELWSIVVAGCAGFMLAEAMLFPGTYTRMQALRLAARDSVKVIVSLVPAFILAAFFESYVTRHTQMPLPASISILLGSLTLIVWYYVVHPIKMARKLNGK